METIVIGADHAGYRLKEALVTHLRQEGYSVEDIGCHSEASVDYPAISAGLAAVMREKMPESAQVRGILCCGSGVGVAMMANRFPWVRAVEAHDVYTAAMSRRHNDANVLCLGGRVIAPEMAIYLLETWLGTPFEGDRHQRRVDMMSCINVEDQKSPNSGRTEEMPAC